MLKTILITGATSGIGRATAELFAKEGHRIILVGRRGERLEQICDELNCPTYPLALDVRDREGIRQALLHLPPAFADIDILINNAGCALGLEKVQSCDFNDWDNMIDINIKGVLNFTRLVLEGMIQKGKGHIINIGSVAGSYAYRGGNVYGSTKAFIEHFSRNLMLDLHGTPIRVTNIEPGLTMTEFSEVRYKGDKEKAQKTYQDNLPLFPVDIAETIMWCASRPSNVNINRIEIMPRSQAPASMAGPINYEKTPS